jgi:hypothetical protein
MPKPLAMPKSMAKTGTTERKDQKVNADALRVPLSSIMPRTERMMTLKIVIKKNLGLGSSLDRILQISVVKNLITFEIMSPFSPFSIFYITLGLIPSIRQAIKWLCDFTKRHFVTPTPSFCEINCGLW